MPFTSQAHGKGNRRGPHQRAEVDQENHRQDCSTAQAVGDCGRPQHGRTAAPANEVLPAYQPQEDFRRFYFRPRPPVPLSLPAAGSVRKARRSGIERGCQKEGTDRQLQEPWSEMGAIFHRVNDHDFRSAAKGIGIPYGIYDTQANRGCVFLGTSHETSAFAVSCLRKWWQMEGHKRYPQSRHILILADTGGSNGAQRGAWKQELQRQLCDGLGLSVTVSHYPSGASKWNPIEHRLFSQISRNWAAEPLDQLREGPQVYPHHHNHDRLESDRTPGPHRLPHGHQGLKTRTRPTLPPTESCPAEMELHHITPDVKLFLGGRLVRTSHTWLGHVAHALVRAVSRLFSTPWAAGNTVLEPRVGTSAGAARTSACATSSRGSVCEKYGLVRTSHNPHFSQPA